MKEKNKNHKIGQKTYQDITNIRELLKEWNCEKADVALEKRVQNRKQSKVNILTVKQNGFFWCSGYHYRLSKDGRVIPLKLQKADIIRFVHNVKNKYHH